MPGPFDPFTPGETTDPTAGLGSSTFDKVRSEWDAFLGDPQGRAALLSAGLQMMQAPNFGEDTVGQIGRAIGAAGESATKNQAQALKEREADSKADLRSAQATNAEARANAADARAGTADARASTAASRLDLARERLESSKTQNMLGNRVKLSGMYQSYVKDIAKRNADPLKTGAPEPVLPMSDWIKQNPMLRNMGLVPDSASGGSGDEDDTNIPATSPSTTTQAPQSGVPAVGEVRKGYRFKGGDPSSQASWEKV